MLTSGGKLNYTEADINENHPGSGASSLNNKLTVALRELPKVNIKGILQGDFMFVKEMLKKETIEWGITLYFSTKYNVYTLYPQYDLQTKSYLLLWVF